MRSQALALAMLAASASTGDAQLKLPNAISSNMVLQRAPLAPRLWGWDTAGAAVSVELDGTAVAHGTADVNGSWVIELPEQKAGNGHSIIITGSGGSNATLTNIAFGDVFLCSGQSNMEFSTNDAFNATEEIADSVNYPDLRLYTIKDTAADTPQYDGVSKAPYQWGVSGPNAFVPVGGSAFSYFSATCYFFGRDLYKSLDGKVPIGLVASDWGGQTVEAFSSPDALADTTCGGTVPNGTGPAFDAVAFAKQEAIRDGPEPNPGPTQLWFGQIYPFLHMRFAGATWYQGEANAGNPASYACRFPAMITDWRQKFDLPELSFFFVQLAAYTSDYSLIRQAQMAALKLPLVGYGTAIDIGDPTSPEGNIHPRRKQEVGRRLSLSCRAIQYGEQGLVYEGPTVRNVNFSETSSVPNATRVAVTYSQSTSETLHFSGTAACAACCSESPFEVQLKSSSAWTRVNFTIDGTNTVVADVPLASSDDEVVGLRYDWEGYPQCALYNGVGGPDNHTGIAAPPFLVAPPTPPPASWIPVFRQTLPGVFKAGEWSLNPDDPSNDMFATLDKLENLRSKQTGGFTFKIQWPDVDGTETMHWKQTSNPVTTVAGGVVGYEAINVTHTQNGWGGLEYNGQECLLDGSVSSATEWFYCVGYYGGQWGHGVAIPSYQRPASAVELFVMNPKTNSWQIVFRQVLPTLWTQGVTSLNKADPGNDTFAILDQLEDFRGADGKLEFKMRWPDAKNVWFQKSNPVTSDGVEGFEPVAVNYAQDFVGLAKNDQPDQSLLDGADGSLWFYAIGYYGTNAWDPQKLIPAYTGTGTWTAELYVRKDYD